MKTCTKCGESKPVTGFHKHKGGCDGLHPQCKACRSAASAKSYVENPSKVNTRNAKWREANSDYNAKWRAENSDHIAKYKAENAARAKAVSAKWEAANPESRRIREHNRRARKHANGGRLSPGLADKLFKLQRGKCACCHVSIADENHMDHVTPLALGGPNEDWNMQLLCVPCNLSKSAKHPVDFMQQRGFLI